MGGVTEPLPRRNDDLVRPRIQPCPPPTEGTVGDNVVRTGFHQCHVEHAVVDAVHLHRSVVGKAVVTRFSRSPRVVITEDEEVRFGDPTGQQFNRSPIVVERANTPWYCAVWTAPSRIVSTPDMLRLHGPLACRRDLASHVEVSVHQTVFQRELAAQQEGEVREIPLALPVTVKKHRRPDTLDPLLIIGERRFTVAHGGQGPNQASSSARPQTLRDEGASMQPVAPGRRIAAIGESVQFHSSVGG